MDSKSKYSNIDNYHSCQSLPDNDQNKIDGILGTFICYKIYTEDSTMVHQVRFWATTAGSVGLIPVWGAKISYATPCGQKVKKEKGTASIFAAEFFILKDDR